jgi:hypothetical protein
MMSKWKDKVSKQQFLLLLLVTGVLFSLIVAFRLSTAFSEWYMRVIYPVAAAILSFVSTLFPFSLYDIFLIVAALLLIVLIVLTAVQKITFSRFLFLLIRFVTLVVAWFYLGWGIAYFRKDF